MSSYARLKGLGIEPDACVNHGVTTSLYYADPDGNQVELQVDNFAVSGSKCHQRLWKATSGPHAPRRLSPSVRGCFANLARRNG